MKLKKIPFLLLSFSVLIIFACENKKEISIPVKNNNDTIATLPTIKNEESIAGTYQGDECSISVEIAKARDGYSYVLKTNNRKLTGKATFSTNESGEKYLVLEGIEWDEYEGDVSHQDETDTLSDPKKTNKELDIPIGIGFAYKKDTLTLQNYGNAMNYYTKLGECDAKYIELVKK